MSRPPRGLWFGPAMGMAPGIGRGGWGGGTTGGKCFRRRASRRARERAASSWISARDSTPRTATNSGRLRVVSCRNPTKRGLDVRFISTVVLIENLRRYKTPIDLGPFCI